MGSCISIVRSRVGDFIPILPHEYDSLVGWFRDYPADAAAIGKLCHDAGLGGASLVELGCGTGNLAMELAALGFEVTGMDRSAESLQIAAAKASGRERPIRLVLLDILEANWTGPKFKVVVAPFSLVCNFYPRGMLDAFWSTIDRLLEPDGIAILNAFSVETLSDTHLRSGGLSAFGVNPSSGHNPATLIRAFQFHGLVSLRFYHRDVDLPMPRIVTYTLKPYTPDRLAASASHHGLELVHAVTYSRRGNAAAAPDEYLAVFRRSERGSGRT